MRWLFSHGEKISHKLIIMVGSSKVLTAKPLHVGEVFYVGQQEDVRLLVMIKNILLYEFHMMVIGEFEG